MLQGKAGGFPEHFPPEGKRGRHLVGKVGLACARSLGSHLPQEEGQHC